MWGEPMPRKGITGHDEWVVTEALATALVALEQLPVQHQPRAHMDDIRKLLSSGRDAAAVSLHLAQAKCRLYPNVDPLTIYQEYGIDDGHYGWIERWLRGSIGPVGGPRGFSPPISHNALTVSTATIDQRSETY